MGHGRRTRMLALGAVLAGAIGGFAAAAETPPAVTVSLFQFSPGQASVARGARVTRTNRDDITHTVTSGTPERRDGRFDVQLAGVGASASVPFTEPGVYPYFCDRHHSMRGEIRVN